MELGMGKGKKNRKKSIVLLLVFLGCFMIPQVASAHATLLQANPVQGSHLDDSPQKVTLTFNERLGGNLYKLKVYNNNRESVTDHQAILSKKHTKLSLGLPSLDDGVYTVSYKVISADGHPISSSYTFTIGDVDSAAVGAEKQNNTDHDHSISTFVVRIAHYLSLLLLAGWTIWGMYLKRETDVEADYRDVHKWLKFIFLFFLLGFGFIEFSGILTDLGSDKIIPLFTTSAVGVSWLTSFILILIAFPWLGKWKWYDGIWVVILLGAEAVNGHALAYHPVALTLSFDLIHLITASIWSGGLLYLLYLWKRYPEHIKRFLPVFSKAALISIVILIITGMLNTFLFLPAISDVFATLWGKLLILKTVLVVAVIVTAGLIRRRMKKGDGNLRARVKVDFTLMVSIFVIVGIFTYLNPVPTNEPLDWKVDKDNVAMTTEITPKTPSSDNTITVKVSVPKKPNNVILTLRYVSDKSDKEGAPIYVPLSYKGSVKDGFAYKATKVSIPYSGEWQIEIQVLDPHDDLTFFKKKMTLYSSTN